MTVHRYFETLTLIYSTFPKMVRLKNRKKFHSPPINRFKAAIILNSLGEGAFTPFSAICK